MVISLSCMYVILTVAFSPLEHCKFYQFYLIETIYLWWWHLNVDTYLVTNQVKISNRRHIILRSDCIVVSFYRSHMLVVGAMLLFKLLYICLVIVFFFVVLWYLRRTTFYIMTPNWFWIKFSCLFIPPLETSPNSESHNEADWILCPASPLLDISNNKFNI